MSIGEDRERSALPRPALLANDVAERALGEGLGAIDGLEVDDVLLDVGREQQEVEDLGDPHDRVEVVPWIESEGRFSFASSDPRVVDLACFAELDGERVGGAA